MSAARPVRLSISMKKQVLALGLTLISVPALSAAPSAARKSCLPQRYSVTAIPLRPAAINQSGEVVGTTPSHKSSIWSRQRGLQEIQVPPGFTDAEGVALNSAGQVIGTAIDRRNSRRQGFTYTDGRLTMLSDGAKALAINDAGMIAGEARNSKGISGPVLWKGPTPLELGGCCGGTAVAINNRGEAVGEIYDQQSHYHAFEWDKTKGLRQIGPPGDFSSAVLLNDAGEYVLRSFPGGLLLYRDGIATHLSLAPKAPSHPKAMNSCGAIVGSYGIFADYYRAFAWDETGGFRDLNTLVPANSGWTLQEATGINDRGQIVGWGTFQKQEDAGFLLTPVD